MNIVLIGFMGSGKTTVGKALSAKSDMEFLDTDALIEACLADDGVLLNLASDEMQSLFHWDKVCARVKVINFYFETRQADGSLKTIVVYCKMARGAMVRAMVKGRLTNPKDLKSVQVEGFQFVPERSDETNWYFELS